MKKEKFYRNIRILNLLIFASAFGVPIFPTGLVAIDHSGHHAKQTIAEKPELAGLMPQASRKIIATTLAVTHQEKTPAEDIAVTVQLADDQKKPIGFAAIRFILNTSFGELMLGSKPTDAAGLAKMNVSGKIRRGRFTLIAQYKGVSSYGPSEVKTELAFPPPKPTVDSSLRPVFPVLVPLAKFLKGFFPESMRSSINRLPNGSLITPYPPLLLVSALVIVFLAIWAIFLHVISLVWEIKKSGETRVQ